MTVSIQTNRTSVVGSGSTGQEVPISFPINATSDLSVYKRVTATGVQTTLTETTNYTVIIVGDSGGTLTTVTTIETTETIHIVNNPPNTQLLDLEQGGSFNAENIEDAFDKTTKLTIKNKDSLERTLAFPATDPSSSFADMPNSIDRASKSLTFDSDGKPTASSAVPTGSVTFSAIGTDVAEAADAATIRSLLSVDASQLTDVTHEDYGADPTGVADSRTAIFNANAIGKTLLFPAGDYKISSDLTITMSCIFLEGAILTPDAGDTVTVEGSASAGDYQIVGGDGTVKFSIGTVNTTWYTNGGVGTSASKWTGPDGQGGIGEAITANLSGVGVTANANRKFKIPIGFITVTDTILINRSRVFVKGPGPGASFIYFASTNANDILFDIKNSTSSTLFYGELSGIDIYDNTGGGLDVVAIRSVNTSRWVFEDIHIDGPTIWDGIGLLIMGREICTYNRVSVDADQPIQISQNTYRADYINIDIDLYTFRDMTLGTPTAGNACVLIDDAVNLSMVVFEGRQTWIGDKALEWIDGTGNKQSRNLIIRNLRHEGATDGTLYAIKVDLSGGTASLIELTLENVKTHDSAKGYYFRQIIRPTLKNCMYGSASLEALNVDSTVDGLTFINDFWQNGCTADLTGQKLLFSVDGYFGNFGDDGALPTNAFYETVDHGSPKTRMTDVISKTYNIVTNDGLVMTNNGHILTN